MLRGHGLDIGRSMECFFALVCKMHRDDSIRGVFAVARARLAAGWGQVDVEDMDEFTRLKKLAARQVLEIRKLIAERDDCLEASSGSSGRQSVMLSSKIREQLRNVKETHDKMQSSLHQEEKDRNKGG